MMNFLCPLEKMQNLVLLKNFLQKKYNISNSDIYTLEYMIEEQERKFKMQKTTMNEDLKKYDVFRLKSGQLKKIEWIKSTDDYNHFVYHLHHFIEKKHYNKNKQWYDERGIKQFLILLPIPIHEQLHGLAIKNLTDEEFKARYKISKWALIFNRKHSTY